MPAVHLDVNGLLCGGSQPSCTNLDNSPGWHVVFRGNQSSSTIQPSAYLLRGDDVTGCELSCPFTLANDASADVGSINSDGLSGCVQTGDCISQSGEDPFVFHAVEILDPAGDVLAIQGHGVNFTPSFAGVSDPAKVGDACRSGSPPPDRP